MPTVLLLGTCDTKLAELLYTKTQLAQSSAVLLMDIGRDATSHAELSITQDDILAPENEPIHGPQISSLDRAEYIAALTPCATNVVSHLYQTRRIHGVLGVGGSCGTALATALMRALPVGFPKMMVSTMGSGDVGPYIGETDIAMMYSVVDIAGRNRVLDRVLSNAAGAIAGMAHVYSNRPLQQPGLNPTDSRVQIGISMFGVTTPAVTAARNHLEFTIPNCEVYVFHATGSGGRALERLVREGQLDAVLDLTTTEIADEVVGGVLSAGASRLCAASIKDIPCVVSVGACDMVNFGPRDSVPARFTDAKRVLHQHNPTVTVMRTTKGECRDIARSIARNLLAGADGRARTKVLLPTGGISMLDAPDQSFWDVEADEILFSTLESELQGSGISIQRDPRHINDPGFATAAADLLRELLEG
ncbi:hypothetical protein N7492_010264 [Penicillium capsulatum]|uniref:Uncharacterized protein n=1 Tax=Penicillium capsulatum TaxID=69766 RepID=A0A9W9HN36_9EURO|nr:hypothetical protein N7492_010264 [Penicillium capsulatum]KAJ6112771.1 hypothetical protein N7512_008095 [Penicillium capsulatum]